MASQADGGGGQRPITAAAVAALVGGRLIGDPDIEVTAIAPLDRAAPHELSFLATARYAAWFAGTRAGVVLVAPSLADAPGTPGARIIVDKPIDAMVSLLARFHRAEVRPLGVHPTAVLNTVLSAVGVDETLGEVADRVDALLE